MIHFVTELFGRNPAVRHSHWLAADVMPTEFSANASSQLQSAVGLFHNAAVP